MSKLPRPATADEVWTIAATPALKAALRNGDNVLSAEREPWLVIDPKPLVGERELAEEVRFGPPVREHVEEVEDHRHERDVLERDDVPSHVARFVGVDSVSDLLPGGKSAPDGPPSGVSMAGNDSSGRPQSPSGSVPLLPSGTLPKTELITPRILVRESSRRK